VAILNRRSKEAEISISSVVRSDALSWHGKRFLVTVLALCLLPCAGTPAEAQSERLSENQIKAGFLFNFTKFVDWPPDAFHDPSVPIELGVVGDTPITDLVLEAAASKIVNGRAVTVKKVKEGQDLRGLHILFVSSAEEKHVTQILERIKGSSVLTVGEADGFAQSGGVINFFVEGNKVRLEINLEAAARSRLKISAKVIAVARLVRGDSAAGGG
jgi:YfiR/HmsC-like